MALQFFPRGGSAHVARNLARALPAWEWDVSVLSGSLPGRAGDARVFYSGCELSEVDMSAALAAPDPMLADPPLHSSYEQRPGAPDRLMASLDAATLEHHVGHWERALARAGAREADVLHLHHLSPLNEAAARVAPDVPVVGHLHGTELLMLEAIAADPGVFPHAEQWRARMSAWAGACERLLVLSASQVARAGELLGVPPEACVLAPNGYDPASFQPREVDRSDFWRRVLVERPRGWRPDAEPGSVAYSARELEAFDGSPPVLLYVGRFTAVKRIGVLLEAHARMRELVPGCRAPLVLCGGFPGEWEGEHPADAIERLGLRDVFLAGWHQHDELPEVMAASDVLVLPSVREQFGQVLVEAMACGLPAIAVNAHGPAEIVEPGRTGELVAPDDVAGLAAALASAVTDRTRWRAMGAAGRERARETYAWPALAGRVASLYDRLARGAHR